MGVSDVESGRLARNASRVRAVNNANMDRNGAPIYALRARDPERLRPYLWSSARGQDPVNAAVQAVREGRSTYIGVRDANAFESVYLAMVMVFSRHWPVAEHPGGWLMIEIEGSRVVPVRIESMDKRHFEPEDPGYKGDPYLGFQTTLFFDVGALIYMPYSINQNREQEQDEQAAGSA